MSDLPTPDPPSYSHPNTLPNDFDIFIPGDILPGYSESTSSSPAGSTAVGRRAPVAAARPPRAPKEFQYKIEAIKGPPIAILTVLGDGFLSQTIPTFIGGGPIKGSVRLKADKADGVQAIVLSLIGRFTSGIEDEQASFLELSDTLYSQAAGAPQAHDGSYLWPFELSIPTELTLPLKKGTEPVRFAPPQTFTERSVLATVWYELGMKIKRKMLRPDYNERITTTIGYIPLLRPQSFSPLRSLAYERGTSLVGPERDREGWHTLDAINMKGPPSTLSADVEIECKLYIAMPLSYTIGTFIPLALKLTVPTSAQHTLDELLSVPNNITVRLRRSIRPHLPQNKMKAPDNLPLVNRTEVRDLYEAVWWVRDQSSTILQAEGDSKSSNYTRWMDGEIHLGKDTKPSSKMPYFEIDYTLCFLPFTVPDAKATITKKTPSLQEQTVEVVTSFAPGPRPVRYAPPGSTSTIVQSEREVFVGFMASRGGFM
ncbi:hypothetical protein BDN70DRAFT_997023 [Pholiota conissans]|uniref:Arrestin-like N-terminal domain-containing protein n=1 Tax=Pholiota conissans TaxID=109636 RepID=A0A9P5YRG6_9AGAR|nr:hypothetical protein BDN70DRAFT_997023 [Pholiota conissans]